MVKVVERGLIIFLKVFLRFRILEFFYMVWRMVCLLKRLYGGGIVIFYVSFFLFLILIACNVGCVCVVLGILKFYEYYLGDNIVENFSDF